MQIHQIPTIEKRKKRIGRGGKKGTYSGRGMKGQMSRAGKRLKPIIREVIKRYPKLRGYRKQNDKPFVAEIGVGTLEKFFAAGETVSPSVLMEKKAIRIIRGESPQVKILANGTLSKALTIEGCKVSAGARKIIEQAGGTVKE